MLEHAGSMYPPEQVIECLVPHISERRIRRMESVLAHRLTSLALGIEDLHHSHNGAACIRTSEALGVQDIVAIENRLNFPEKAERSATRSGVTMYSDRWIDLHRVSGSDSLLDWARSRDMRIVGTSPHARLTLDELPVDKPLMVLFGNERDGLREETSKACDQVFQIPMFGFTESFNISVSAGMILSRLTERVRARLAEEGRTGDMPVLRQRHLFARWCLATVRRSDLILKRSLGDSVSE